LYDLCAAFSVINADDGDVHSLEEILSVHTTLWR